MRSTLAAIVVLFAVVSGSSAWGQGSPADVTDMQALRAAVKADKKSFVASTLALTDVEAKKFWPLYNDYQRLVDLANRERAVALEGLIATDRPISDAFARNLAKQVVEADETEVRARRKLYGSLMRALPAKKAARYLQLESKIRAAQAYDVAAAIPLIK